MHVVCILPVYVILVEICLYDFITYVITCSLIMCLYSPK